MKTRHPLVIAVFTAVWHRWLVDERGRYYRVRYVSGWRSCLYDTPGGQRQHATFEDWPWTPQ